MNLFSRMNLPQKAPFSYLEFCINLVTSLIQKAFKFIMKYIFGRNSSPKVICWWPRPSQILYRIALHFFLVFKKWLGEVYRRFGTETNPVVSLNYLLPIGTIWWRCSLCCAVSCSHLLRCSRWIWSRRFRSRGNAVCSVTSLTRRQGGHLAIYG